MLSTAETQHKRKPMLFYSTMNSSKTKTFYLTTIILMCIASNAAAHSHLAKPLPTRRLDCRVGNRPRECPGPCPLMDTYGAPTGITHSKPAETWRRGQGQTIEWHRNNHGNEESGFVRFSLVPVEMMMSKGAHKKFTFQVSCWNSGLHKCRSRNIHVCGNDAEGMAYRVRITVPAVYPDGVYVFGWAWYGGGTHTQRSFFGDYYSCSFIRIQGGVKVVSSWKPIFTPGLFEKKRTTCRSAANRLGVCPREPCHVGPLREMKPVGLPTAIRAQDISPSAPSSRAPSISQQTSFKMLGLEVIDVANGRVRLSTTKQVYVKLSSYRDGFTIGARVQGQVRKVVFRARQSIHTETLEPFIINGNVGDKFSAVYCVRLQSFPLTIAIEGSRGEKRIYTFNVNCI